MEHERFLWQVVPDDPEARLAIESRIAGYRADPAAIKLRVGDRYPILKIGVLPVDHRGSVIEWHGHRVDGIADLSIARFDGRGNIEAVAPGTTHLALTPGYRTATGDLVTLQVRIDVRPA